MKDIIYKIKINSITCNLDTTKLTWMGKKLITKECLEIILLDIL